MRWTEFCGFSRTHSLIPYGSSWIYSPAQGWLLTPAFSTSLPSGIWVNLFGILTTAISFSFSFFFTFVCVLYVHVCMEAHIHTHVHMEARGWHWESSSLSTLFTEEVSQSSMRLVELGSLASQLALGNPPSLPSEAGVADGLPHPLGILHGCWGAELQAFPLMLQVLYPQSPVPSSF